MSEPLATITRLGPQGMVTIRGDLAALADPIKAATGLDVPGTRRVSTGAGALAWLSPDELMLFCDHADAPAKVAALTGAFGDAFALAVDVSDARVVFEIAGPHWREVLAKVTPADMAPGALAPDELRRTRLAQVAGAVWQTGPDTARVMVFRSVADYVETLLATAAKPGTEVGIF